MWIEGQISTMFCDWLTRECVHISLSFLNSYVEFDPTLQYILIRLTKSPQLNNDKTHQVSSFKTPRFRLRPSFYRVSDEGVAGDENLGVEASWCVRIGPA